MDANVIRGGEQGVKNDVFSVTFIKAKTASRGEGDEMMMKETNPQIARRLIQNSTKYFHKEF